MNYLKQNYLKILVLGLFLLTGLFLSSESLIKKTRNLKKSISDKIELVYVLNWQAKKVNLEKSDLKLPRLIAHASGGVGGMKYTNSLEGLNKSYKNGFRFIEMDLSWTSDGELVALHGWESEIEGLFNEEKGIRSLEEFNNFEMMGSLTQMDIDDVARWFKSHEDVYFITDIKENNVKALEKIINDYPDLQSRIIPQVYFFKEYKYLVELGFDKIMLMLHRANYHHNLVRDFINEKEIFAISLPTNQFGQEGDLIKKAGDLGIPVFTHTINNQEEVDKFENMGIYGVYTDFLIMN